jgi:hypothetical protein
MSTWIQDNKTSLVITGVGAVLVAGLATVGFMKSSEESEARDAITAATDTISSASSSGLTPTKKTLDGAKKLLADYETNMAQIEGAFAPFKATSALEVIDAQSFQNRLKEDVAQWTKVCEGKEITIAPEAKMMGFGQYMNQAPGSEATSMLAFQEKGLNFFLTQLVNAGVTKMTKVYRAPLAVELPPKKDEKNGPARSRKASEPLYVTMPFEVTFEGKRETLVQFLNTIQSNDQYLYTIAALRVKNEKQQAPSFEQKKPATSAVSGAPGVAVEEEKSAEPEEEVAREILKPVLGDEKVNVHLVVNLIHFPQKVEKPTKAPAPKAEPADDTTEDDAE